MATIQCKTTNGHKYWYIVESRRVNGKPRPVVLAYLGKAESLLEKLQGINKSFALKSYSHGLVSKLLSTADELDICDILNRYTCSTKSYTADKPIRNGMTAGATLLLAAIGRACTITSKSGWAEWAQTTSMEYLLRTSFAKIDSQHFWDGFDAFDSAYIQNAELDILKNVFKAYSIDTDSLFYDTTNFYTYIDSSNNSCDIAQRGKNKQKRSDLRQIGLALVVTKHDMIPIFHHSYKGNLHDSTVFRDVIGKIKERLEKLGVDIDKHTIVFDRGNNSKKNIDLISDLKLHYTGALTPYHHKELVREANERFSPLKISNEQSIMAYRTKTNIWGHDMTVVVMISDKLKDGQIKGIYTSLDNCEQALIKLKSQINSTGRGIKNYSPEEAECAAASIIEKFGMQVIVDYQINNHPDGSIGFDYMIKYDKLAELEEEMGFRIIMTDRHDWDTVEIINAYHGQHHIENTFKNMKNQQHLSFNPQYHWTDQKIRVHNFCCVISYLLTSLIFKKARESGYTGTMSSMLTKLMNIRLGALIENTEKRGAKRVNYVLEEMNEQEKQLAEALGINKIHEKAIKIKGFGIYN